MSAPSHIITIEQLVNLIKNHPNKKDILYLQSLEYGCKEYQQKKKYLPAIKAHGSFSGLKVSEVIDFNKYFYFDIDNTDLEPKQIKEKYPFISLITKSVGGKGIFFLVKVDIDVDATNHTHIHNFIGNMFDLKLDANAKGITRNIIIPSYKDVIWEDTTLSINTNELSEYIGKVNSVKKLKTRQEKEKEEEYGLNEPLFSQLNFRTKYDKEISQFYNVEEMEWADIFIPPVIKDGTKHKLYAKLVNQIVYLNPNIKVEQVIGFISQINKDKGKPPMDQKRLIQIVRWTYNNIITTGEIKATTRTKKIHFKMSKQLTIKEKQVLAAKANGVLRTNSTIDKIQEATNILLNNNEKITNKRLAEITGLSIATIKRNKCKEKENPMKFNDYQPAKSLEDTLPTINAEEFWGNEPYETLNEPINEPVKVEEKVIEYKWKGIKNVKITLSKNDKELFKGMIEALNNKHSISQLLEMNVMDEYKIDYLYNKWINKYGYENINEIHLNDI